MFSFVPRLPRAWLPKIEAGPNPCFATAERGPEFIRSAAPLLRAIERKTTCLLPTRKRLKI